MVLSVVDYNPSSGDFHWRWRQGRERTTLTWNSRFAFKKCSSINSDGYLMIMINGKAYPAHRLAWLIVYGTMPDGFIDHINRVRTDNRISNLRLVSRSQNNMNTITSKRNRSGCRGVCFHSRDRLWHARVFVNRKTAAFKTFKRKEDAIKFVTSEREKIFGSYNKNCGECAG